MSDHISGLELNDIQDGMLRPRPTPYAGTYIAFRIDERAAGHEMLKRLTPLVASAADATSPAGGASFMVGLSYHGLKVLGLPQASLDSFSPAFQQGMAARAEELGDVGQSSPENWERPLGTSEVHLVSLRSHLITRAWSRSWSLQDRPTSRWLA